VLEGEEQVNLLVGEKHIELYYWNGYTILHYNKETGKITLDARNKQDKALVKKVLSKYLKNPLSDIIKNKIKIALLA
jgi:hypothetical protein